MVEVEAGEGDHESAWQKETTLQLLYNNLRTADIGTSRECDEEREDKLGRCYIKQPMAIRSDIRFIRSMVQPIYNF